ncbi:MAG: ABC transporter ATP-binding protein [Bacilli bacterium]|nr:ABC transporter ATP-binding protein [Bacilli bacterium]
MKNILSIKNLRKTYHTKNDEIVAVENFSYDFKEGNIIAIVGPSGCGKSTILNIIGNLINKSDGELIFNDDCKIGYMLQEDCLFPFRTIIKNCLLGLEIKKEISSKNINYANQLLKKYGLYDFKNKYPNTLSGGMKQRVALIRTLVCNPNLILLDEPFSAIDYQTRLLLSDDIYKIIKEENKTAILITHNIEEAVALADNIIVLSNRPSKIKNIYTINLFDKSIPSINRRDKNFNYYCDLIWKDIDFNV